MKRFSYYKYMHLYKIALYMYLKKRVCVVLTQSFLNA